jgi:hypothetical protein
MFAVDPGLKDPPGILLMAGQTVTNLFFGPPQRRKKEKDEENG